MDLKLTERTDNLYPCEPEWLRKLYLQLWCGVCVVRTSSGPYIDSLFLGANANPDSANAEHCCVVERLG